MSCAFLAYKKRCRKSQALDEENYNIFHIWNGGSLEITASIRFDVYTGYPKKHGNSVTNLISSLLWISIVMPNFKSHNIIMPDRVYSMKRVKDCKDVSIMSPQDEQWSEVCILQFSCFTKYNRMQSKHKQTKCEHSRRNSYGLQLPQ